MEGPTGAVESADGHVNCVVSQFAPPISDNELQHVATAPALKILGIDVGPDFQATFEDRVMVRGADGHLWHTWAFDRVFLFARRQRTTAEMEAWIDANNSLVFVSFINKDRVVALRYIARAIEEIADSPMPRSGRRAIKQRLAALSEVSLELLYLPKLSMREVRERLAAVGVQVPQVSYLLQ